MIFIDLFGNPPSPELIAEGEKLTRELIALAPDSEMLLLISMMIIGVN